ncbi:uncharacterized protein SPSK_03047 [Sporothrix schenckii 1099-18]|uniref:Ubiquitin-like protease family profile domain-containing protein n=1 Tax=Sporothrix schenckii 1099-18 TaxID=1397361 RepID=A0A0F2M1D3_SPOSC|nr:uncharacterized protein SPSK_03047 [Sporothrix schenckii 1099-18]KJR81951.1 hypothetical protein SPSK_03047 [Sporothrix schenckii 1099-18]
MSADNTVEARAIQGDEIRKKAAHITTVLRHRHGDAAGAATTAVDEFVAACNILPPGQGQTAADLASALGRSTCRRLEEAALRSFERQLRGRTRPDGTMPRVPRALAELQSAAKAWRLSPLVLLAEFADAPKSDNFWRLLARLARSRCHGSWPDVRERLQVARHRRRYDRLARRQGVSYIQPWAIPDIMAVLKQHEEESEEDQDGEEEHEEERGQDQEHGQEHDQVHQRANDNPITRTGRDDAAAGHAAHRPTALSDTLDSTNIAIPIPQRPDSDGESGENGGSETGDATLSDTIYVSGSEQTSVWRFAYGWWLPTDVVHRLCSSFVHIQPELFQFAASGAGVSCPADETMDILSPRLGRPDAGTSTIIAPLRIKTSNHWILATLCPSENVVSVYDPQPGSRLSHTEIAAALDGALTCEQIPAGGEALAVADCAFVMRSCPTLANSIDSGVAVIALSLYCLVGRAMPTSMDNWLWRRMLAFYLTRLSPDDAAQTTKDIALATLFAQTLSARNIHTPADTTSTNPADFAAEPPPQRSDRDQGHMDAERNLIDGIQQQPFVGRNILAQRNSVIEGRAIWTAAARLASRAEADARRKRDDIASELQRVVDALFHHNTQSDTRRHTRHRDAKAAFEVDGDTLTMSVRRLETAVKTAEADMAGIAAVVNGIRAVLDDLDTLLPKQQNKRGDGDDNENSDGEFRPPRPFQTSTTPAKKQYATRSTGKCTTKTTETTNTSKLNSAINTNNTISPRRQCEILPHCSQVCMLGLRNGGALDRACQNVQLHPSIENGHHKLTPVQFCNRLRERLAHDMGEDCEALDKFSKFGAIGMLFRLTLRSHGYCVAAEGVQRVHAQRLQQEKDIYDHLQEQ